MKSNMDIWADAWALAQRQAWQRLAEPSPGVRVVPPGRPPALVRQEAKRQETLAKKKQALPPLPPGEIYTYTQCCWIEGFTSWTAATVPISVACLQDYYADGHHQDWALMSTHPSLGAPATVGYYRQRTAIEERHRQLKCFYDLSHFRSRSFNAIAAQVVMVLLTYTLRQWQLWNFCRKPSPT
jgi:hypothetical protein